MSYAQTRVRNSLTTERDTLIEQSMTRLFYRRIADTYLVRKGMVGYATMRCTILPYLASVERLRPAISGLILKLMRAVFDFARWGVIPCI